MLNPLHSPLFADYLQVSQREINADHLDTALALLAKLLEVEKVAFYVAGDEGALVETTGEMTLSALFPRVSRLPLPFPHRMVNFAGQDYVFLDANTEVSVASGWLISWDVEAAHCLPIKMNGGLKGAVLFGEQGVPSLWQEDKLMLASSLLAMLTPWTEYQRSGRAILPQSVLELASESILLTDPMDVIVDVNAAFTRTTGYSHEDCFGKSATLLRSGRHSDEFYQHISDTVEKSGFWHGEIWNKRKNGELYPQWLSITCLHDDKGEVFRRLSVYSDITTLVHNPLIHDHSGAVDQVTGLPNNKMLLAHLERSVALCSRRARTLGLLVITVSPKAPNDAFENSEFAHVAGVILRSIRQNDYLARVNSKQFALVLDEYDHSDKLARVACKMIQTLHQNMIDERVSDALHVSVGIARLGEDASTAETLEAAALEAARRASNDKSSRFYFYDEFLNSRWSRLWPLATQLGDAIDKNQLKLYYQPVVNVETQEVVEIEAMVRWHHPNLGWISASDFRSVAKASGLSNELFSWALLAASSCFNRIQAGGYGPLPVALNLNGHELTENDSFNQVLQFLVDANVAPGQIKLEIPEKYLLPHWNELKHILEQMRASGVQIIMDAYGAEQASLYALAALDIDGMKLDRSMVADIEEHPLGQGGVAALLAAASCLQFDTVAVGVENERQSQWLAQSGCVLQQGDYFAQPMDEVSVVRWLRCRNS